MLQPAGLAANYIAGSIGVNFSVISPGPMIIPETITDSGSVDWSEPVDKLRYVALADLSNPILSEVSRSISFSTRTKLLVPPADPSFFAAWVAEPAASIVGA